MAQKLNLWVCKDPKGKVLILTFAYSKKDSIQLFNEHWDDFATAKQNGFSCKKVLLSIEELK